MLETIATLHLPTKSPLTSTMTFFITLGAHAQRGYGSWVCVSVCYSTSTSRVFVLLLKDMTYLTGNEGRYIVRFSLKMLRCKARARKGQYANTQWTG